MKLNKKAKEVAIDLLARIAQVMFLAFVATPFVNKDPSLLLLFVGLLSFLLISIIAIFIAITIKEEG